jgi:hypothetical protein
VLSPEQHDFKARRLKTIKRRHRAWLRQSVADDDTDGADFGAMFD